MSTWLLILIHLIPIFQCNKNFSFSASPKCKSLSDCPTGYSNCSSVSKLGENRCIKDMKQICIGGMPEYPIKSCERARDCTGNLMEYEGWCDFETKFCCQANPESREIPLCPDRITPIYGQEKCTDVEGVYSGNSNQKGGFCYKGYSCPPKITRPHELKFGSKTFRTNMDCSSDVEVGAKYEFMFCHNETGNLWVMGQYNVNGDEVIKHWTQCKINSDCGEGLVCVKEDLCRYRCYDNPTTPVNYNWIVVQIFSMFCIPLIFLASVICLTVKHMD